MAKRVVNRANNLQKAVHAHHVELLLIDNSTTEIHTQATHAQNTYTSDLHVHML